MYRTENFGLIACLQSYASPKLKNWMRVQDPFSRIWSHILNIVCDIMHVLTLILHNASTIIIMIDTVIDCLML